MTLTVIVPVYNRSSDLSRCLAALASSSRRADEVIVVDDGSSDDSIAVARQAGARVIQVADGPRGPANARNRGAEAATGTVLVFLDSDVLVHADSLARIETTFQQKPGLSALFGSYDDCPPDRGVISRYKNLLHHFTHQNSRREATTFWAGCGAVDRLAFASCGGFDESYQQPSIEDIELGARMVQMGMLVWSCPEILCTHLKRWTFSNLVRTDIFQRALPWSRLIRSHRSLPNDLNLGWASRLSAAAAWILIGSLFACLFTSWAVLTGGAAAALILACNAGLFQFFKQTEGLRFTGWAFSLHTFYLLYSSLVFAMVVGPSTLSRSKVQAERPSTIGSTGVFEPRPNLAVDVR